MKFLMFFVVLAFLNCESIINGSIINEDNILIVIKKEYTQNGYCDFKISVSPYNHIILNEFPCDSFSVGDTINLYD